MVFSHFGITVSDLERSLSFYCDAVGFVEDRRSEMASSAFARLTGHPGQPRLHVAFLSLGGVTLQLIEYIEGQGPKLEPGHNKTGSPHISIAVDDVRDTLARIRSVYDGAVLSDLVEILADTWSFYVLDPDGVPVEFIQYPGR